MRVLTWSEKRLTPVDNLIIKFWRKRNRRWVQETRDFVLFLLLFLSFLFHFLVRWCVCSTVADYWINVMMIMKMIRFNDHLPTLPSYLYPLLLKGVVVKVIIIIFISSLLILFSRLTSYFFELEDFSFCGWLGICDRWESEWMNRREIEWQAEN